MKNLYTKETCNFQWRKFVKLKTTTVHPLCIIYSSFSFANHNKKTSNYGLETVSHKAPLLWATFPSEYKNSTTLSKFKTKMKNWRGDEICPCRLCKVYLPNMGYIWYDRNMESFCILKNFTQININNNNKIYTILYKIFIIYV